MCIHPTARLDVLCRPSSKHLTAPTTPASLLPLRPTALHCTALHCTALHWYTPLPLGRSLTQGAALYSHGLVSIGEIVTFIQVRPYLALIQRLYIPYLSPKSSPSSRCALGAGPPGCPSVVPRPGTSIPHPIGAIVTFLQFVSMVVQRLARTLHSHSLSFPTKPNVNNLWCPLFAPPLPGVAPGGARAPPPPRPRPRPRRPRRGPPPPPRPLPLLRRRGRGALLLRRGRGHEGGEPGSADRRRRRRGQGRPPRGGGPGPRPRAQAAAGPLGRGGHGAASAVFFPRAGVALAAAGCTPSTASAATSLAAGAGSVRAAGLVPGAGSWRTSWEDGM